MSAEPGWTHAGPDSLLARHHSIPGSQARMKPRVQMACLPNLQILVLVWTRQYALRIIR